MKLDEARALYFLARNRLTERRGRQSAADALQRAHALATELRAAPLAKLAEDLARQAHLPVTATAHLAADVPRSGIRLVGGLHLTPRESEVLEHIVAGQTYAQIARELFISEKTVSVHVSSLLHKTGTTSRIQLAERCR
jgi:DNA-binding NarL/FixJ family response regulator